MRAELGVIQFTNGEGHVLFADVLHNSSAVTEHIGVTYITCLPHVILQVLPTAAGGKTCGRTGATVRAELQQLVDVNHDEHWSLKAP